MNQEQRRKHIHGVCWRVGFRSHVFPIQPWFLSIFQSVRDGGQNLFYEEKTEHKNFSDLFLSLQEFWLCLFSNVFFDYVAINKSLNSIFKEICISGHYLQKSGGTLE